MPIDYYIISEKNKEDLKKARKTAEALLKEHFKKEFPKLDVDSIKFKWKD